MKNFVSVIGQRFSKKIIGDFSFGRINDQRKIKHLLYTIAFTAVGALVFIPVHVFLVGSYLAGLFNFICAVLCGLTMFDLWRRGNLRQSLWISVILTSALVIAVFWALKGNYQISSYLIIPPGFAFLLLGYRNGIFFSLVYASLIVVIILLNLNEWPEFRDNYASFFNLMGALILALFWGSVAEYVRGDTFNAMEKIADSDTLTSSVNRRHFFEEMENVRKVTRYQSSSFGMIMMDIDYFKSINDNFGHDSGDKALVDLVALLKSLIRKNDIIGRLGGDEFGLLFPGITKEEAIVRAETIRQAVEQHSFMTPDGRPIPVTISMGLAMFTHDSSLTAEQISKVADLQLYQAKKAGKNRISVSAD